MHSARGRSQPVRRELPKGEAGRTGYAVKQKPQLEAEAYHTRPPRAKGH